MGDTKLDLEAIKKLRAAITRGPWRWVINQDGKCVDLRNLRTELVMDMVRYGMSGAAPRFPHGPIMRRADEYITTHPTHEHHAHFFANIKHPNADFIAAAPEIVDALLAQVAEQAAEISRLQKAAMESEMGKALIDAVAEIAALTAKLAEAEAEAKMYAQGILFACAGIVPTPERGYIKDGGSRLATHDLGKLREVAERADSEMEMASEYSRMLNVAYAERDAATARAEKAERLWEIADERDAATAARAESLRGALERIAKSDINNFDTIHPEHCADVARRALTAAAGEGT